VLVRHVEVLPVVLDRLLELPLRRQLSVFVS
jgi:hypothetical protein